MSYCLPLGILERVMGVILMSRLEEYGFDVEKEMKHLKNIVEKDDSLTVSSRFVKYLIQQAERVQELEGMKVNDGRENVNYYRNKCLELEEENQRYKQALEKLKQLTYLKPGGLSALFGRMYEIADNALKGESE